MQSMWSIVCQPDWPITKALPVWSVGDQDDRDDAVMRMKRF